MANSDCIVIQGSNMAECHPVAYQWVTEAKAAGARVIHVDPRFTRTSAVADRHIPIRAGSDVVLLGALIREVLRREAYFREYVVAYTNAATLVSEDFQDVDDLGGVFSGYDAATGTYDMSSWAYQHVSGQGTDPDTDTEAEVPPEGHGAAGPPIDGSQPDRDETLQHPRCVFQVLARHFARYTPEMVTRMCGISVADFEYLLESIIANSGRERTTSFVYAVGWTQHTLGAQFIRAAAILQLLLGNVGRPGGGIMALRGHASIQGSTDIPTLFNLLPGYLPMPVAGTHDTLQDYLRAVVVPGQVGYGANADAYTVSLLKAWWGDAARADNDWAYGYLPRLTGSHSTYDSVMGMIDGSVHGYFLLGQNPAVGSSHGRLQRQGMAALQWLVVRDLQLIESATFWKDGPEIASGQWRTEEIGTEVFFLPAASHAEKDGSFTQTHRMLQWHHAAVAPPGDARSELQFFYDLGQRLRAKLADSTDSRDRPLLDLTWDYPVDAHGEPAAEAVLKEINGRYLTGPRAGQPLPSFTELRADGSTASGCWIYSGVYAGGVNRAAKRTPWRDQPPAAPDWGWAWPANRRILYNRASADPQGRPWSERKRYLWWDADAGESGEWTGYDVPDFPLSTPPSYRPAQGAVGVAGLSGTDAFVMQADGVGWLYAPRGVVDGPIPTHYEAQESPVANRLNDQQRNPARRVYPRPDNPSAPSAGEPGSQVYPFVFTTYRLTEHHTAGGMSRWLPHLAELQPEFFCEVSPELAALRGLVHGGWATIVSPRAAIEARVLVTSRMTPLSIDGDTVHQIGLPYHWGVGGSAVVSGDSANDLLGLTLDPNVFIQESKVASCDIVAGRRPRGLELDVLVRSYRERAGIQVMTGNRHRNEPTPDGVPDQDGVPHQDGWGGQE
ncbi:MAG: molybdopterin-dependent oxidoreductase [Austwickia sp.]|nr:molybdopterin-dependent oxidoreductase [Austwickia sp.]